MTNFDFQQTAPAIQELLNSIPDKATKEELEQLRELYEALTQSEIIPVPSADWPVSDPQENVIYRVAGTSSYTDYMWDGTSFIPMATYDNVPTDIPTVGSTDVITAGGVANHGSAFDISEYNKNGATLATYANLSAALAAVPSSVQKGGMSIKFVRSSDNKYVQYRLMEDTWSIDTDKWALCSEDVLIDNPEWVKVVTDSEDRVLYGVKPDGKFYFGDGCPQQVKDYIEEKIAELSLDEYEDIVAFLIDYLGSDTTLKVLIDDINERIPELIDNPEFISVEIDAENKIVSYRNNDGIKHEEVGLETNTVIVNDHLELSDNAIEKLKNDIGNIPNSVILSNAQINLFQENELTVLQRENTALKEEINSLKLVKNGSTQDTVNINLTGTGSKKLILNLHKRASIAGAQSNDVFLPNARNDFSDVRVFANGKMLPYKVVNRGDYDIVPTEDFGHNCITKPWQNSDGNILYSGSVTGYKPGISTDDGHTWTVLDDIKDGFTGNVYISFLDKDDTMFIGDGSLLYRSPYPYTTKELVLDISDNGAYTGCHILSTDICQHPDGELFLGSYQLEKAIRIYKSVNGGVTWTKIFHNTDYQHVHHIMCDTHQTPAVIYAGCDDSNGLFVSNDKGTTWIDLNANGNLIRAIDYGVIYADNGFRLLGGETQHQGGHSIIRTTDDNSFSGVLSAGQACYMCQKLGDTLFAGLLSTLSYKGTEIVVSKDSGLTWETAYSTMGVQQSTASDGFRIMQKLKEKNTDTEYIYVGCQDFGSLHQNDLKIYADDAHFAEIIVDVPQGVSSVRVESGYLISDNKEIYNDSTAQNKVFELIPLNDSLLYDKIGNNYIEGDFNLYSPIKRLGNYVGRIISGNNSISLKSGMPIENAQINISNCAAITISFWIKYSVNCDIEILNWIKFSTTGFYFSMDKDYSANNYLFGFGRPIVNSAHKIDLIFDFANNKASMFFNGTGYHYSDAVEKNNVDFGSFKDNRIWTLFNPLSIQGDALVSEFMIRNYAISADEAMNEYFNRLDDNTNK